MRDRHQVGDGVRRACELPATDPALERLTATQRSAVARLWRARALNELKTAEVFARLQGGLLALPAEPALLELSERAPEDERRHGRICQEVAERYAPAAEGATDDTNDTSQPPHEHTPAGYAPNDLTLLKTVAQCCVNETIAATYLKTCLAQAEGAIAAQALRALLADEIAHSRIGWALLASAHVTPEKRALVARTMPAILRDVARVWLADPRQIHARAPLGHGSLSEADTAAAVRTTVEDLVAPGLEHVGVDAGPTRSWLAGLP